MGFGTSSFGTSSLGISTSGIVYPADYTFDPYYIGGYVKYINPLIGDYVRDEDLLGLPFKQMKPNVQRVVLALSTPKGKISYNQDYGDETLLLEIAGVGFIEKVKKLTENALSFLVKEGAIKIISIDVVIGEGYFKRKVSFVDLFDNQIYNGVPVLWQKPTNLQHRKLKNRSLDL